MKVFIDNIIVDKEDKGELYLESDGARQYTLRVYNGKVDKHGNAMYQNAGYFSKANAALRHCIHLDIHHLTAKTLLELAKQIEKIEKKFDDKQIMKVKREALLQELEDLDKQIGDKTA